MVPLFQAASSATDKVVRWAGVHTTKCRVFITAVFTVSTVVTYIPIQNTAAVETSEIVSHTVS